MPLHPQYQALLDQMAAAGGRPLSDLPIAEGRAMYRAMQPLAPDIPVGSVEDRRIPGPAGEIPIRIYTPTGKGPFPVLMNFHGGDWVIGDPDTADAQCRDNAEGYLLTRSDMEWFWHNYCPKAADRAHPYASPARASDFAGLPPALVLTAEYDPRRDEGEAYAAMLKAAAVATECVRYDGLIHGFFAISHIVSAGRPGMEKAAAALRHVFDR